MATPKSSKKKKSKAAKKPVPILKKKKKLAEKQKKRVVKKTKKPMLKAKPKKPAPAPKVKRENEATRRLLVEMREKQLAEFSEKLIPKGIEAQSEIGDIIDQAGDERDRELSLLLTGRDKEKLRAIDEALEKIEEGTYGICEECGEKIGPSRLKVMPLAKYCVNCQSRLEEEMDIERRSEEDLTYRGLAFTPGFDEEEG
jgi:DnaK suppressor protein